jgi:hypothetical protein
MESIRVTPYSIRIAGQFYTGSVGGVMNETFGVLELTEKDINKLEEAIKIYHKKPNKTVGDIIGVE